MQIFNIKNITRWLAATALLWSTSCKDDTFGEFNDNNSDEVTVSFTLLPEAPSVTASRATNDDGYIDYENSPRIGDGSKVDMVVYAIYDKEGTLITGFAPETSNVPGHTPGEGQTILAVDKFPVTINITLKRNEEYDIAFWAQSSKTHAYNTQDLKKVEVLYGEIAQERQQGAANTQAADAQTGDGVKLETSTPNNDEFRDAFCRSVNIIPGINGTVSRNVYLYRPLAQINVGTSGFDYEAIVRNFPGKYVYSKVRINRAARYLDVVEDKVYHSTTNTTNPFDCEPEDEAFSVVDFGYAPIAAYANYYDSDTETYTFPKRHSVTKWDWNYNGNGFEYFDAKKEDYEKEEFLRVNLYNEDSNGESIVKTKTPADKYVALDGDYYGYANLNNYDGYTGETFKYLSMSYILTASSQTAATTIDNIKVWLSSNTEGTDAVTVLDINNIPVQRNWRTNIVGSLLTEDVNLNVMLDRNFAGEYNSGNQTWSGPLADGVYYDAVLDEIQISNANGLLWFQRMVNGTMKVREAVLSQYVGQDYPYYDINKQTKRLHYSGISQPQQDEELAARILRATHQDMNSNSEKKWPKADNFHFVGKDDQGNESPATVRLMADIDMSGIEWIPIGFEGRVGEQALYTLKDVDDNVASNRIFYGIFDGNGHTISNLTTKNFSANVHKESQQVDNFTSSSGTRWPIDNPQWWGYGLFGQIGGNAKIRNVRLLNVNISGFSGVGGIVGNAYGDAIEITDCVVDGGNVVANPMYRGDSKLTKAEKAQNNRTYARGVYAGAIVGYFNTEGGRVDNCSVRNLRIQGVRRVGGLIGSIAQKTMGDGGDSQEIATERDSKPASISNNRIDNSILIASSFTTYGNKTSELDKDNKDKWNESNLTLLGFGWNGNQFSTYAQKIVGGDSRTEEERTDLGTFTGNDASGLTFASFAVSGYKDDGGVLHPRTTELGPSPLKYLPMLSKWFVDEVTLSSNYYGEPSAYTRVNLWPFQFLSLRTEQSGYDLNSFNSSYDGNKGQIKNKGTVHLYPIRQPESNDIDWVDENDVNYDTYKSGRAGLYVETIHLKGNAIGGHSVITPVNVTGEYDCSVYVTASNRHQFTSDATIYKNEAVIENLIIRGEPYAYTGMLVAGNKNMSGLTLKNVSIYDVYRTIAPDDFSNITVQTVWPNVNPNYDAGNPTVAASADRPLTVEDCNLRGYTQPGIYWSEITYKGTTFEQGTSTGHGTDEYTIKVEKTNRGTVFNGCYFKAPFIIDIAEDANWTFEGSNYATATSTANKKIAPDANKTCIRIEITSDMQGNPQIEYTYKD